MRYTYVILVLMMVVVVGTAAAKPPPAQPAAAPRPQAAARALTFGDYTYFTNAAGQATISAFNKNYTGALAITNTLGGCPVTSIGDQSFAGCIGLTSVTIPSGVNSIENFAFDGCTGLTNITIPASVTYIGISSFQGCTGLTGVMISVGVTDIGQRAFDGCSGLTSVTIPDRVSRIEPGVFSGCSGLTNAMIPASVTSIGYRAFDGCTGLRRFTVDSANTKYSARDGVLFNKNQTELKQYPSGKTGCYVIPATVACIQPEAFYGCTGLTNVTIPASVTNIGFGAFQGCTNLPASIQNLVPASPLRTVISLPAEGVTRQTRTLQAPHITSIRRGQTPKPIPLAKEQDDQLVKEGILPALEKDGNKTKVQPKPEGDGIPPSHR